jgi:hypothetical protein
MLHMIGEGHILTIVYVNVTWWKTTNCHSQVILNVYVMLHMIGEGHILTIVYVNVTWWKITTCHSQVLQNVCVNVTHDSRMSYSQHCLSKCYMVEDNNLSFSSSPKCLCKCYA